MRISNNAAIIANKPLDRNHISGDANFVETTMSTWRFGLTIGSRPVAFGIHRVRSRQTTGDWQSPPGRSGNGYRLFRTGGYISLGLVAVLAVLMFSDALRASFRPAAPYTVVMSVPDLAAVPAATPKAHHRHRSVAQQPSEREYAGIAEPRDDADGTTAGPSPLLGGNDVAHVAAALNGDPEVQEFTVGDGARAFAVYGSPYTTGRKTCRDVSVLVRRTDGENKVASHAMCSSAK